MAHAYVMMSFKPAIKKVKESSRETIFTLVIERLTTVVDNVLHNE